MAKRKNLVRALFADIAAEEAAKQAEKQAAPEKKRRGGLTLLLVLACIAGFCALWFFWALRAY